MKRGLYRHWLYLLPISTSSQSSILIPEDRSKLRTKLRDVMIEQQQVIVSKDRQWIEWFLKLDESCYGLRRYGSYKQVSGVQVGKERLSWEWEEHVDGVPCPSLTQSRDNGDRSACSVRTQADKTWDLSLQGSEVSCSMWNWHVTTMVNGRVAIDEVHFLPLILSWGRRLPSIKTGRTSGRVRRKASGRSWGVSTVRWMHHLVV